MQFFDFQPVVVPGLKKSIIRFPATFVGYPVGGNVSLTLTPEKLTTYGDGRECIDRMDGITVSIADADLTRSITLRHPVTGETIGTFTLADFAAMTYSVQIDMYEREQSRLAQIESVRLAALAAPATATTQPIDAVTPPSAP